jgi:hypothetical protein
VIDMLSLQHPYISIALPHGKSYGGGQQLSRDAMLRRCGCGVVAAADLLLYLTRWHSHGAVDYFAGLLTDEPVPLPVYDALLRDLSRREFSMIPYAGINGVMLMAGMQLFFRRHGMPYTARWCIAPGRLWERIEEMLGADIPVIMSVGPNFPFIWGDKRVRFYAQAPTGGYVPASRAKAHYFTVTGLDCEWLRISSWGRCYYLRRREFEDYVKHASTTIASNVLLVTRK